MHGPAGTACTSHVTIAPLLCCVAGVEPRRNPSRAPVGCTQLEATSAETPEGHALLQEGQEPNPKGQEGQEEKASSSSSVDTPPAVAQASPVVDRSSAEGREEEAGLAQNVAAVAKETDAAASVGQSAEEEEVMAELLAHQPGGQDEAKEVEGALPRVSCALLQCSCSRVGCSARINLAAVVQ